MMVWWFSVPKVVFGEDALSELEILSGKRALILTDSVVNGFGFPEKIKSILVDNQWEVDIWDGAVPDPKVSTVKEAAQFLTKFNADTIIAVGGGSVIDTAKAAWVLYESPETKLHELTPFDELGLRTKAKLVCIPTTAGTGSEATKAIVIREDDTGRKFATVNPELTPDLAILEPEFVKGLPKNLTANTGMDALTHAVEGYVSVWKNDFSDGCSLKAVQMIFEWLPKSVGNLADLEAREKMLVAANLAGMSFGNSQACLAHSLGHSLGSVLRIQHGMAVGMALPYTIEFIARDNPEPAKHYWELSQLIGVDNDDHEGAAMEFAERIRGLQKDTDFPLNLKDAGVSKKDFDSGLEQLVEYAMMDTSLTMTPKSIQSADIRKLYKYMFEGKTVDF
ncbi:MAG: iron-containing alcohol dehydrogenase [Candidatus Thorarchaeota archaeon]|jgi:alcohol dehydrogenase class IV